MWQLFCEKYVCGFGLRDNQYSLFCDYKMTFGVPEENEISQQDYLYSAIGNQCRRCIILDSNVATQWMCG